MADVIMIGATVRLKSDTKQPFMVVMAIGDYSHDGIGPKHGAKCEWRDVQGNRQESVYAVSSLETVDVDEYR